MTKTVQASEDAKESAIAQETQVLSPVNSEQQRLEPPVDSRLPERRSVEPEQKPPDDGS